MAILIIDPLSPRSPSLYEKSSENDKNLVHIEVNMLPLE